MPPLTSRNPSADSAAASRLALATICRLVLGERRLHRFLEAHRLGRDDVHQRPALDAREHRAIEILLVLRAAQDHAAARAAQRLVRGGGDEVGVRHRARVHVRGDQTGDVRHVGDDRRADRLADGADPLELDDARVGARADHDHLRLVLVRQPLELLVVDPLVVFAHAVGDDGVELAGEVQRMAVREVAAVREVHAEHGVARLQQREVDRHVRLRARVRLHVGVLGAEQLLRARDRQRLGDVDELAAAVVALARIAFGVLVGQHRAGRLQHRLADEVLRGDQLEAGVLAVLFVLDGVGDLRIGGGQRAPAGRGFGVRAHACRCSCSRSFSRVWPS